MLVYAGTELAFSGNRPGAYLVKMSAQTGSHAPAAGQSKFDQIFLRNDRSGFRYEIPYPISRLIDKIEEHLGSSVNNDANRVQSALFPLSRCIGRYAAYPDFYRFPRFVLAVDSENRGARDTDALYLKDQLFLGYQQKSGVLDVISYNSEVGRFEFQVVGNYSADGVPEVINVARETCATCHQNEGPIFPRGQWDETDHNPEILKRIAEAQQFPPDQMPVSFGSRAASVDGAINRANMFSLFQKFWREICRSNCEADAYRCRAGLLETILRHRLASTYRARFPSRLASEYLIPIAEENIQKTWPNGIAIHSSDISNENPLSAGAEAHLRSAELLKLPRPKGITWRPDNIYRMIQGLGSFISFDDIQKLDNILFRQIQSRGSGSEKLEGTCLLKRLDTADHSATDSGLSGDISVQCDWPKTALSNNHRFFAEFYIYNGSIKSYPVLNRMSIDGPNFVVGLTHRGATVGFDKGHHTIGLDLYDSTNRLHAQTPGGRIIAHLKISWTGNFLLSNDSRRIEESPGTATLTLLQDSGLLTKAVTELASLQDKGVSTVLSDRPFHARPVMDALFRLLEGNRSARPVERTPPIVCVEDARQSRIAEFR